MPAERWAVLRPLEALNSVMYSDLCLGALGVPDLDLEGDLDVDRLLQATAPKCVKLKLRTVSAPSCSSQDAQQSLHSKAVPDSAPVGARIRQTL